GVYVTLDEFKGRCPIQRGALVVESDAQSFDNPLTTRHYEAQSGGSRSSGTRFVVDLEGLAHDGHYDTLFFDMFGVTSRPGALWHPAPPGAAGLKWALRLSRMGRPLEHWFSQTPMSFDRDPKNAALMHGIAVVSRLAGRPVPRPEHVGLS